MSSRSHKMPKLITAKILLWKFRPTKYKFEYRIRKFSKNSVQKYVLPQPVATSFRIVEMENNEIQRISNKFTQNLLIIQIIVFLSLVALMVSTTYLLKRELANQAIRTVGGKVKRGDTREIINILSDSENNDFIAVDFYNKNSHLQFTFPTSFRRNISLYSKIVAKVDPCNLSKKNLL